MDIRTLSRVNAFITKDGSEIRELLAYRNSVIRKQSLAEARLPAGACTQEHYHAVTEEIYYITAGTGRLRVGDEVAEVAAGDAIAIPPGRKHKLWNTGSDLLTLLCCCTPAYATRRHVSDGDLKVRGSASTFRHMKSRHVRLFIKPYCGWCHDASDWLEERGIPFETLDVISDPTARREMVHLSGQTLAPVIDVDGEVLADFDTDQLAAFWKRLEQSPS